MRRVYWLLVALGGVGVLYALSRTQRGSDIAANIVGGAVDKLKAFMVDEEGERLKVYLDNATPPVWTVGVGHKILTTDGVMRDGVRLKLHPFGPVTVITQTESDAFFRDDMKSATATVDSAVKVLLTSNQRAALISLVFNIGAPAFTRGGPNGGPSTILRKVNERDFTGAANEFSRWIYSGDKTKPNPVLVGRRDRERTLFLS
jgi:lysozyme